MVASTLPLQGQQPPPVSAPVTQPASTEEQEPQPAANSAPAPSPAPALVDPKTAAPVSAADQREKDIDKHDPLKQHTAAASPDAAREPGLGPEAASADSASDSKAAGDSADAPELNTVDYAGPAVLSRSYTLARPMEQKQVKWVASFGFSYAWDDGETPTVVNGNTVFQPTTADSRTYSWTLSGRHSWSHDAVGLSYAGTYSQYSLGGLSGVNNMLNLDYGHLITRRLSFQLVESVQDLSQNYSLGNPALQPGASVANINLATSPNVELLNSTVRQSSSSASLTYQQTSRLSYNLSASYFIVGRTGVGIVGTTGRQAGADVNYRWTRRATLGAYYSYTNYSYSHNVSNADSHGMGMIYSYALNRSTQIRTRIGATRIESLAYATVVLSPALAAILGQSATIVNSYSRSWISDVSVELARDLRGGRSASVAFARGESPGNGILLTSVQQTVSAGYAMSLLRRRLPVSTGVDYTTLNSTSQGNVGYFKSELAYVGTSRPLGHGANATFRLDYRRYDISGSSVLQHDLRISIGLLWSPPGDLLRF